MTKRVARDDGVGRDLQDVEQRLLAFDADQRDAEDARENSTTAGTTLFASELNGFDGM